jgi:hypothetical protein
MFNADHSKAAKDSVRNFPKNPPHHRKENKSLQNRVAETKP